MEKWPKPILYILMRTTTFAVVDLFIWNNLCGPKILFQDVTIWNLNFANYHEWRNNRTKVVVLDNIYNFPIEIFFIWIHLGCSKYSFQDSEMYMPLRHNILWGRVVREAIHEAALIQVEWKMGIHISGLVLWRWSETFSALDPSLQRTEHKYVFGKTNG